MAKLKVSVDVPMSPEDAWDRASDLTEFEQWAQHPRGLA